MQMKLFESEGRIDRIEVTGDADDDMIAQLKVFAESLAIYRDRSNTRGQAWKDHDLTDALHHIRDIASRFEQLHRAIVRYESTQEMEAAAVDWALDLNNYSAFFIRKVKGE